MLTKVSYCLELLYKYEMVRDTYLNVTKRNHYNIERLSNKLRYSRVEFTQVMKLIEAHLRISRIAYVGDGFLPKVRMG